MKVLLRRVKRYLDQYKLCRIAREIKWVIHRSIKEGDDPDRRVVSLKPQGFSRGNVLLSYIIDPFLLKPNEPIPHDHTNYWESMEIAKTFLSLGYSVDAISFKNMTFIPQKKYTFFIDARWNLQRLTPLINKDCAKIMHIDLCHVLFNNAAEANRLLSLQQRRGATLRPRRFELPNLGIEHADCAVIIGNKFTMDTFRYAKKPMYPVPVVGLFLYPSPEEKDVEGCRKNYLWFGSGGLVRKGLDLVLEAFAEMPDYHLTVMGPVKQEGDFEKVYHKELYETPNIHTVGWINLDGPEFLEIANQSLGLVYPSCSEGQAGSVICCLHAGLIPIVSYESGVDVEGFGTTLRECSIEEIKNSIRATSSLPGEVLRQKALKAWNYARTHHTKERYRDEYKRIVVEILERTLETPVQTRTKNK